MNTPVRIQRKRKKGWTMPENTVYVGRGTKWGNPFKVKGKKIFVQRFHEPYWVPFDNIEYFDPNKKAKELFNIFIRFNSRKYKDKFNLEELRGKNLSCWCKEGESCHADVLLKLANR